MHISDLKKGDEFVSPGWTITREQVLLFPVVRGAVRPLHSERSSAQRAQGDEPTVQKPLLEACAVAALPIEGATPQSTGFRFKAPVLAGDTIQVKGKVTRVALIGSERRLVACSLDVVNQNGATVARGQVVLR